MEVEKKRKRNFLDHAADKFDIPSDALGGYPRVTITGTTHVLVDNHKGILDYGTEEIAVAGKHMAIKIVGANLNLRAMNTDSLLVMGDIFRVEYVHTS